MSGQISIGEILDRAAHQQITIRELDILVYKTRELSIIRERELNRLHKLLAELEARRETH